MKKAASSSTSMDRENSSLFHEATRLLLGAIKSVWKAPTGSRDIKVTLQFKEVAGTPTRLRDRAFRAGGWTLGAYGVELCIRLLSNLILTRLLFPEAFGTVAAATALVAGLSLVSDFGIHAVIIQSPRGEQVAFLQSAWVFQLFRGIAIWALLLALCAFISIPAVQGLLPVGSVFAGHLFPLVTAISGFCLSSEWCRVCRDFVEYKTS